MHATKIKINKNPQWLSSKVEGKVAALNQQPNCSLIPRTDSVLGLTIFQLIATTKPTVLQPQP